MQLSICNPGRSDDERGGPALSPAAYEVCSTDIVFYPLHRNLVTFGSPHQGVFGIPECEAEVPAAPDFFLALEYFHARWEIPFCVSWRAN